MSSIRSNRRTRASRSGRTPRIAPTRGAGAPARDGGAEGGALAALERASSADRRKLARLERRMTERLEAGEQAAWDVGIAFDRLARRALHHVAGYETLEAYADARFPRYGYSTLKRFRRVALAFTRATAGRHSVLKLELGLRYIELTPASERPAEIPRLAIRVPEVGPVPFARVTTRQLEDAIGALSAEPAAKVAPLPRGAGAKVRALEARLSGGAPWPIHRPHLSARTTRDEDDSAHALVTIHDVPVEHLPRLARAILAKT